MEEIKKITTEYAPDQDRIRLSVELKDTRCITLWLTRKFIKIFVPHLLQWVQKKTLSNSNTGKQRENNEINNLANYVDETIQSFAQAAALSSLHSQNRVMLTSDAPDYLVDSIDISYANAFVQVVFKPAVIKENAISTYVRMHEELLRQWLNIIYDQAKKAEWQLEIWPEWMIDSNKQSIKPTNITLH